MGEYKARSTTTTAGKVTTTTARHGEATTTMDSKTMSAATTTSPQQFDRATQQQLGRRALQQAHVWKIYTAVGWNRFQPTITSRTTDDNQLVAVWLSVVQWLQNNQLVAVSVVAKWGKKLDLTGPETTNAYEWGHNQAVNIHFD
ncbi:hypothetical protein EDB89DRAFT_1914059 [Lactarius sanguifluus]|nr:hypothetical protein EDB89DRAFT_1914059 [Lactarius sanguifluus]